MTILDAGTGGGRLAFGNAVRRIFMSGMTSTREQANREAFPGMTAETILTSGPRLEWGDYVGGQREAIIGGAIFEGLARDREDADKKLREGRIRIDGCQAYNAVGSVAGIYTASMPVFAVRNARFGNVGYCNF